MLDRGLLARVVLQTDANVPRRVSVERLENASSRTSCQGAAAAARAAVARPAAAARPAGALPVGSPPAAPQEAAIVTRGPGAAIAGRPPSENEMKERECMI